jgi:HK97 family phage major capsid protein
MKELTAEQLAMLSPEQQTRYKQMQAQMQDLEKDLVEAANSEPALPSNVTPLNMSQFADLVGAKIQDALKGLSVVDRKHGFLPSDGNDDPAKLDRKEQCVRFLKAVWGGDNATARKLQGDGLSQKGLTEGTTTAGGYLVPEEFRNEILRMANQYGIARRDCRVVPMKRDKMNFPTAGATGVTVYWVSEANSITASTPNFGRVTLNTQKAAGLTILSSELVDDADNDVIGYLAELFGEGIAYAEDYQWLRGTGSPITGLLGSSSVNVVTMGAGKTGFDKIDFDELSRMIDEVSASAEVNARFYLHKNILHYLRTKKDNEGRYIWTPPAAGMPGTICGFPYTVSEAMPGKTATAPETKFIAFGNGRYSLFGDRKQITMDVSKDAYIDTTSLFQTDQQALRVIERLDIQIGIAAAYSVLKTAAV